jgi:hypothetical protein
MTQSSKARALIFILALSILVANANAADKDYFGTIKSKMSKIVCSVSSVVFNIASGVAAVVFVIAGVKWVGSENDPGARKQAKDAMIHALVGLVILQVIPSIISLVMSTQDKPFLVCK